MNKNLLSTAVTAALTLGLGLPSAHANSGILFPYVVKDTNRTTVISVIGGGNPVSAGTTLHLQYWTKSTTDANTAACQPNSTTMTFTENDVASWDTAALLAPGPLFGDITNNAPLGSSIAYAAPRHGYLVVEWTSRFPYAGYWMELDLANGGAHGDAGVRSFELESFNAGDNYAYGYPLDYAYLNPSFGYGPGSYLPLTGLLPGEADPYFFANPPAARAVQFWPAAIVSTAFTVTPMGTAMQTNDNSQVIMQVLNRNNVQGAYDRNENGVDGTVRQTVRCVGRLTAAQLMPGVVANAAWAAQGGWGFLANLGDGDTDYREGFTLGGGADLPAMVYQIDSSNAAGTGKFMTNATRIDSYDFAFGLEGAPAPAPAPAPVP